jgi:hypothetical protein
MHIFNFEPVKRVVDSVCNVLKHLTGAKCINVIVSFGGLELVGTQLDVGPVRMNVLGFDWSIVRTVTLLTGFRMLEVAPFMFPNDACGTANTALLEGALPPPKGMRAFVHVCCSTVVWGPAHPRFVRQWLQRTLQCHARLQMMPRVVPSDGSSCFPLLQPPVVSMSQHHMMT